jgi:threonyl-tRNA synthetase
VRTREEAIRGIRATRYYAYGDGNLQSRDGREEPDLGGVASSLLPVFRNGHGGDARPSTAEAAAALRRLGWLAPEPASESGHVRILPPGMFAYRTLRDWLEEWVGLRVGGEEVRTPLLFGWEGPENPVRDLAETFHQRLYFAGPHGEDGNLMLRYSADPGLFSMLRGKRIPQRQLPLRLWEFVDAYRRDRSGELKDLARLRSFSFIDHHTLCPDEASRVEEYTKIMKEQLRLASSIGHPSAVELTMTERAFEAYPQVVTAAASFSEAPVLLELLSEERHYWSVKHHLRDPSGMKTFNLQLDLRNSHRFGISVEEALLERSPPVVVHGSSAAIERWMLVFTLAALGSGGPPTYPLWLSPAQVRLLPAQEKHLDEARRFADELTAGGVRVQIDDRSRPVRWRVAAAGREWIPYVGVVGEREIGGSSLPIRSRDGSLSEMSVSLLCSTVQHSVKDFPRRRRGPELLSRRATLA